MFKERKTKTEGEKKQSKKERQRMRGKKSGELWKVGVGADVHFAWKRPTRRKLEKKGFGRNRME